MARKGKPENQVKAFAYLRTSSAANVGEDKDSQRRQLDAIERFAKRHGFTIIGTFTDDAVSGEDDIASRPGFSAMLDALEANGTRTVIVEDASRFARKMLVQELGIVALIARQVCCWSILLQKSVGSTLSAGAVI
jgi:DNA invertase Pin-like site-specific DNA recombinase